MGREAGLLGGWWEGSSALDASPGEADLKDATSSHLPLDCPVAVPKV